MGYLALTFASLDVSLPSIRAAQYFNNFATNLNLERLVSFPESFVLHKKTWHDFEPHSNNDSDNDEQMVEKDRESSDGEDSGSTDSSQKGRMPR